METTNPLGGIIAFENGDLIDAGLVTVSHDPFCTACEHDCPWRKNPMGAPFCSICDDHNEAPR